MADKTDGGVIEYQITADDDDIKITLHQIEGDASKTGSTIASALGNASKQASSEMRSDSEGTATHSRSIWAAASEGIGNTLKRMGSAAWGAVKEIGIGVLREIGAQSLRALENVVGKIASLVKEGIAYNAQIESYTAAFQRLTGSADSAKKIIDELKADAKGKQFDVSALADANQALMAAGVSAEDSRKTVNALGEAITATGGDSSTFTRMVYNLQQVKNTGKATAMDIRQFAMAGINVYGILADYTGKSVEQVQKMDISYEVLAGALQKAASAGGKYYGASTSQLKTYNGQLNLLKANVKSLFGSLTQGAETALAQKVMPLLNNMVSKLQEAYENDGWEGLGEQFGKSLADIATQAAQAMPEIVKTGTTIIKNLIKGVKDNKAEIHQGVVETIDALIDGITDLAPDIFEAGADVIVDLVEGLANNADKIVDGIIKIFEAMIEAIFKIDWIDVGYKIMKAIWKGLNSFNIKDKTQQLVDNYANSVSGGSSTSSSSSTGRSHGGSSSSFSTSSGGGGGFGSFTKSLATINTGVSLSRAAPINLTGNVTMDGYKVGVVNMRVLDDVSSTTLKR